jgi:periplasmic divalent cation tolerance protein
VANPILVQTTYAAQGEARQAARQLVEAGLAACVQIVGPIDSLYRWYGKLAEATEWLCLIKTTADRYAELERAIVDAHPYDVPEVVSIAIDAASQPYLEWLASAGT